MGDRQVFSLINCQNEYPLDAFFYSNILSLESNQKSIDILDIRLMIALKCLHNQEFQYQINI